MYLGVIVQIGFERKLKVFETVGVLQPGDFYGHKECHLRTSYPCSLVAIEPCSYCVLPVKVILRITKEYPGIAMELQAALGRYVNPSSHTPSDTPSHHMTTSSTPFDTSCFGQLSGENLITSTCYYLKV